jgi:hypothetical protein
MYHCVLLFLSPFEAVEPVPLAVSLPEEAVMGRPPATLVYAGSESC